MKYKVGFRFRWLSDGDVGTVISYSKYKMTIHWRSAGGNWQYDEDFLEDAFEEWKELPNFNDYVKQIQDR